MSGYIAERFEPVTASDTTDLPTGLCKGLLVDVPGAATLVDATGAVRTAVPLKEGYNPLAAKRIYATGLTASGLWALY